MPISDDLIADLARDIADLATFILVADDDDVFRGNLVHALRKKGFSVIESKSGDGAVALCQTARPGGVVMDYRFDAGGLNGIQAMRAMEKIHPNHGGINALIVTERDKDAISDQGFQVLTKSEAKVEFIAERCFEGIKRQVRDLVKPHLQVIFDSLDSYEQLLGNQPQNFQEVARYRGVVTDVEIANLKDAARIQLFRNDGGDFYRIIPRSRLEAIGAAFDTAEIEYTLQVGGSISLSRIRYIGPTAEHLMAEPIVALTDEEIEELDSDEWRNS